MSHDLATLVRRAGDFLAGLADRFDPVRARVAFTGGKDSTVALWLWRETLARRGLSPKALSLDTGFKFPEVVARRDSVAEAWGVDLHVARPTVDLENYPVARDKTACCEELKVRPLLAAIKELGVDLLITGIRGDEHVSRAGRQVLETLDDPPHQRAHPLLSWTEMDVWGLIHDQGLPYCELYDQGYRSLGCAPCTRPAVGSDTGERSGRDRDKEARLAELRSLGYF